MEDTKISNPPSQMLCHIQRNVLSTILKNLENILK